MQSPKTIKDYVSQMTVIPGGVYTVGRCGEENFTFDDRYGMKVVSADVNLNSFLMGATPVTVGMWREFCSATSYPTPYEKELEYDDYYDDDELEDWFGDLDDDLPITDITWNDVTGPNGFCAWASKSLGMTLMTPSVDQWLVAATGGQGVMNFPWGNDYDDNLLWASPYCSRQTVASVVRNHNIHRNKFGLSDMVGNVWQMCQVGSLDYGACVGGAWSEGSVTYNQCFYFGGRTPDDGDGDVGFRLVCNLT